MILLIGGLPKLALVLESKWCVALAPRGLRLFVEAGRVLGMLAFNRGE